MDFSKTLGLSFIAAAVLAGSLPCAAQAPEDVRTAFLEWAKGSAHPVIDATLESSTDDLQPLREMIGNARIVALSEAVHAGAEPLAFRNRLFKYLVEELGFNAIAIESGLVESRIAGDYVMDGTGDLDSAVEQGVTWTFDTFPQNSELLSWMRRHNARLPAGARKLQFYGFDVAGSPGNLDAARGPDTALEVALQYLRTVDPPAADQLRSRVKAVLPQLKSSNYADLQQAQRDGLTAAIADLIALLERRRLDYIDKSSQSDYDWGQRAAVGARQVDAWWGRTPIGWKVADGFAWSPSAMKTRDRAMADNLEWIVDRLGPTGRVLVFASVNHIAATPLEYPDKPERNAVPFGTYAKARFGPDFISVLNLVANGEIINCSLLEPRQMRLALAPPASVEVLFSAVNRPRYLLDLRRAPPTVALWLRQPQNHWNGFAAARFPTLGAFDIAFYVSPVTSACAARLRPAK
jgi:erythromycin esterase